MGEAPEVTVLQDGGALLHTLGETLAAVGANELLVQVLIFFFSLSLEQKHTLTFLELRRSKELRLLLSWNYKGYPG